MIVVVVCSGRQKKKKKTDRYKLNTLGNESKHKNIHGTGRRKKKKWTKGNKKKREKRSRI